MKKLGLLVFLFGILFNARASHVGGGEIYYEFIADLGNNQTKYRVTVIVYRSDLSTTSVYLYYSSSCDPGSNLMMTEVPGFTYNYQDCLDTTAYIPQKYVADVVLPKRCYDWSFNWVSNCCMPMVYTNAQANSNFGNVPDAVLNNQFYNNSSPQFIDSPSRGFCVSGNQYTWKQRAIEFQGDSLSYKLRDLAGSTWATGHSQNNPFGSPTGMNIDSVNGIYSFQAAQAGIYLVELEVEEYRRDTAFNWHYAGSITRLMAIPIYLNCDTSLVNWTINTDNLNQKQNLDVTCGTQVLEISVPNGFQCGSLVPTDFALYDSAGTIFPIVKAEGNCVFGVADSLYLELHNPLHYNGTYNLVSRTGSDGNTLVGFCGHALAAFDTTKVLVSGCSGIGLAESNHANKIQLYPNPFENRFTIDVNSFEKPAFIQIQDQLGRILFIQRTFESSKIDIHHHFQDGIYFVKVGLENGVSRTFKMLKSS